MIGAVFIAVVVLLARRLQPFVLKDIPNQLLLRRDSLEFCLSLHWTLLRRNCLRLCSHPRFIDIEQGLYILITHQALVPRRLYRLQVVLVLQTTDPSMERRVVRRRRCAVRFHDLSTQQVWVLARMLARGHASVLHERRLRRSQEQRMVF